MSATRELQRRLRAEESQPRFEPCLPRPTKEPPSGPGWIHEIKHDGFRILAHRQGPTIRLITRNGYDFSDRFLLIVDAVAALPVRSCIVDGEAIAVDEDGLSVFDLVRNRRQDDAVLLCAFGDRGVTLRARRRQHRLQRGDIGWKLIRALAHATHGIRFAPSCDPQSAA